ncbi:MAG: hypothetical protein GY710_12400 [Desulfobacteraceae bacterium]|nr:hypothetical protein [Desulfobacteraceae bacterium]
MKTLSIDNNLYKANILRSSIQRDDLTVFPSIKKIPTGVSVIAVGDLHGSAIKLLYFLIKYGLIRCNTMDYAWLMGAYTENQAKRFAMLLKKSIKPSSLSNTPLILFIGDTLADRGMNDYMTLKIYELMKNFTINFKIIFSNHDLEFVVNFKKGLLRRNAKPKSFILGEPDSMARSMMNLHRSINSGEINEKEVQQLVNRIYIPRLQLAYYHRMDYIQYRSETLVFTHAPVNIGFLERCLDFLSKEKTSAIKFEFKMIYDVQSIIKIIDKLNNLFDLDTFIKMHKNFNFTFSMQAFEIFPLIKLVWNRNPSKTDSLRPGHKVKFIHGHIGQEYPVNKNSFNLDSYFGKTNEGQFPMPVAMIKELMVGGSVISSDFFAQSQPT